MSEENFELIRIINLLSHVSFDRLREEIINKVEYSNFFKRLSYEELIINIEPRSIIYEIIQSLNNIFDIKIISIFANYYRDGKDYAPYHHDKYILPMITASFGCDRDFYIKNNETKVVHKFILKHGDVVCMKDELNEKYKHSIPKRERLREERISILFFYCNI